MVQYAYRRVVKMKARAFCNLSCKKDFPVEKAPDSRKYKGNCKITEYYITCPNCGMAYPCWYVYRKKVYHTILDVEAAINAK
jgi:hypothetical protein